MNFGSLDFWISGILDFGSSEVRKVMELGISSSCKLR